MVVLIGLVRLLVVVQVDGLGADQPEVPPDFGEEIVQEEVVERPVEQLAVRQCELALCLDLEEVDSTGLESNLSL